MLSRFFKFYKIELFLFIVACSVIFGGILSLIVIEKETAVISTIFLFLILFTHGVLTNYNLLINLKYIFSGNIVDAEDNTLSLNQLLMKNYLLGKDSFLFIPSDTGGYTYFEEFPKK